MIIKMTPQTLSMSTGSSCTRVLTDSVNAAIRYVTSRGRYPANQLPHRASVRAKLGNVEYDIRCEHTTKRRLPRLTAAIGLE